ncbi:MAG: methyltransferase domain-containing protein [Pseudomonadota bacterium]
MKGLQQSLYFFSRFLSDPHSVASVLPSSKELSQQMFQGMSFKSGDTILEYGPGTGSFTRIVQDLQRKGTELNYLGIERDPGMYRHLLKQFPDMMFEQGDVKDVRTICEKHALAPIDFVVSGLPLVYMGSSLDALLSDTCHVMKPGGVFRTFSYVHCYPLRRANLVRNAMRRAFSESGVNSLVLKNVPPAFVLHGLKEA